MCPESWLDELGSDSTPPTRADLREALRPLCACEVELILVSHGEPVLQGARAALQRALELAAT
jgi:hypothetical protein